MPKEMERFGTVKVISGEFKGRIGYYDDDDYIFPDGIVFDDNDKMKILLIMQSLPLLFILDIFL